MGKQVAPGVTQVAAGLVKLLKGEQNVKSQNKKGKKRASSEQANGSAGDAIKSAKKTKKTKGTPKKTAKA